MLNYLPDDIILHIISLTNKHRLMNTTLKLSHDIRNTINTKLTKTKYRLTLIIKLNYDIRQLFKIIRNNLKSLFSRDGCNTLFNNQCLSYAPVIQYGICRFCNKHRGEHKYIKLMNIYHNCIYIYGTNAPC